MQGYVRLRKFVCDIEVTSGLRRFLMNMNRIGALGCFCYWAFAERCSAAEFHLSILTLEVEKCQTHRQYKVFQALALSFAE